MIKAITEKLTQCPSYLKKGDVWLADYFNCSPTTIKRIKASLKGVKKDYVENSYAIVYGKPYTNYMN